MLKLWCGPTRHTGATVVTVDLRDRHTPSKMDAASEVRQEGEIRAAREHREAEEPLAIGDARKPLTAPVHHAIPVASQTSPSRQWVLTFPHRLRCRPGMKSSIVSECSLDVDHGDEGNYAARAEKPAWEFTPLTAIYGDEQIEWFRCGDVTSLTPFLIGSSLTGEASMSIMIRRLTVSLLMAAVFLVAEPVATFHLQRSTPGIQFTDTRLENGLRVIIAEDRSAPVFSIVVNYNVGSRDERKGRTGFAHFFEHMMFKGSANVGPGEHPYLMFMYGGNMNGTTSKDRTVFYETLPANQLDLALFLEADRMRSLEITRENLENQRNAVQEERRLGVDNQPYGRSFEVRDELAYDNAAYEHSVIGSMADLNAATVEDVAAFFKTYYAPNNAVVAIVGDVETKTTLEKMRKHFGSIPRQQPPPPST